MTGVATALASAGCPPITAPAAATAVRATATRARMVFPMVLSSELPRSDFEKGKSAGPRPESLRCGHSV
ncbi:unnamed protein product [[Actinomadura] parvosata subsp. kistnae]|nr:unnamed protein product [Actinomadura parvosata subsp. kistnae]